jgi:hypothetical protein
MAPENPEFSKMAMLVWTLALGMIYGLLIELITSVFFKARKKLDCQHSAIRGIR